MLPCPASERRQRGVALAYLLWMLAGLSLLVSGLMTLSLGDVRATSLQRDQAQARAIGTGAAHLLLRDMRSPDPADQELPPAGSIVTRDYSLGGYRAVARAIPVSGLVSLRTAPAELLALMFQHLGGLSPAAARELGEAVVTWREEQAQVDQDPAPPGFLVTEDLLRVPGMTRSVYDRVRSVVHAQNRGGAGVSPAGAPPSLLLALAGGDETTVDAVVKAREETRTGGLNSLSGLAADHLAGAADDSVYRLEVDVYLEDGRVLQQRIWAELASGSGGVPWQFVRVEPVVAADRVDNKE